MNTAEQMSLKVKICEVFRPGAPIDKYELFAGRMNQVSDVVTATVQPGRHVIMFGERGVGKTSLAKVISEVLSNAGHKLLDSGTINCDGTDDFSSLWHKIFRELSFVIEAKHAGFIGGGTSSVGRISLENALPEQARPDDVRYVLTRLNQPSIIIIDEVDRIKDRETTTLLADTIKNLSDHSVNTTLILVGVADSVEGLITEHKSVERALVQVPMPRMSKAELTQVMDKGLNAVGMTIDEGAKTWVVDLSQGLPHYTHMIGLYSALNAVKNDRTHIDINDVAEATSTTVEKAHTILSAYHKAVSSPQKQSLYAKVLLACALAETDELGYFTAADVSRPMSQIMRKPYYVPNFSRHLDDFCDEKRGPVLQKIGVPRGYRFRFINPLMQPFVIIHGYSIGVLTNELLRQATRKTDN